MQVEIISSARLHLGFYAISTKNVAYGGIGVAIEKPHLIMQVEESRGVQIENLTSVHVEEDVKKVIEWLDLPGAKVKVLEAIPRHVGLGSTTQLRLSLAYALSKIYNRKKSIRELAFIVKRGWISGIGIAAFEKGGFILDAGRIPENGKVSDPKGWKDLPFMMYRRTVPKNWLFLVALPEESTGLDEHEEKPLLENIEPNMRLERNLHEIVLLQMLPALVRRDIVRFGKAITRLQILVGKYFAKYQDGEFCCFETENLVRHMLKKGAYGAGQSSWGPAAYGLIDSKKAVELKEAVEKYVDRTGIKCKVFLTQVRNRGFSLKFIESKNYGYSAST
ncbi:TPA: hypothetical protein EYP70_03005 [Candidatus Bathyarchaeota archaeon]|nr:hypothetical protein [Candidatus Bathyarchaeota archaeon]